MVGIVKHIINRKEIFMKAILDWLKNVIGEKAVAVLLAQFLTKENILKVITFLLDQAEELAKKTGTTIDDQIVKKLKDILEIKPE